MSGSPAVSVIVPVLNGERTIGALLAGLGSQLPSALGETEVILVDNGCVDGTRSVIEAKALPGLRVVDEPVRGVSAARNRGMLEARGQILAVIDADCVPSRRWLRELTEPFSAGHVTIAAGSLASYPPRTGAQRFAARYGLNDALRCVQAPVMPFANGRNMAVRRDAAVEVGGWPVDLIPGDDIEFAYRIRRHFGGAIAYREQALVFHQDRERDDQLRRQAMGYGRGIALVYAAHPDLLPWSWQRDAHRLRTSVGRVVRAAATRAGARIGLVAAADAEFASYLARWDGWFWEGFHEQRRASRGAAR